MPCDRTDSVLHAYFDGELDFSSAAEFERHLAECADCREALRGLEPLRASIGTAQLYQNAPSRLKRKVEKALNVSRPVSSLPAQTSWGWLALAAALALLAVMGWQIVSLRQADKQSALAIEVVDAHLRSLEPGHLTDIPSSDQHTVKPWFEGKLDFAPPVKDFTELGFPLRGGRLDVIQGRSVAALVYGRQKHIVSVFIWPASKRDAVRRSRSYQGYQCLEWQQGGMEFWAVSDTALADLEQLQRLFSE